jgi:myo-inositol-1(or 4)-monophosphatase
MHPMVNIALRAARKAGSNIERAMENLDHLEVKAKSPNDFVTEVDNAAEQEILFHLKKAYPDHAFLCEESGLTGAENADYRWVIDPLDGTTNYIRGIPHFAVSIACLYRGRIEHAVIYDPIRREEFIASRGRGAQLNGRRIRVRKEYKKDNALFATGIPFGTCEEKPLDEFLQIMKTLTTGSSGVRRCGAASLDLAYVAAGRYDAFWERGLKPWDMAAGALLILEAGGLVSGFEGGNDYLETGNIVCGSPKAFKATLQVVRQQSVGST